jgi:hypothetical protein
MFDDEQYQSIGHIRPLTYWELDKSLTDAGFRINEHYFHNHYDLIPRTIGEVVKLTATFVLTPIVRGVAGGQCIIIIAQRDQYLGQVEAESASLIRSPAFSRSSNRN